MRRIDPALLVVLGGVSAALHVGKLPPALPVLREALGISLVQAGFLLSLVQLAGMALGLVVGLAADSLGPRRTMVTGLLLLALASLLGAWSDTPAMLLALRALEGLGFLLASLPAPGLIRRLVEPARLARTLGLWGAYMPIGTASALLAGPAVIALAGWPAWWVLLALLSLLMGGWLWRALPASLDRPTGGAASSPAILQRLRRTLRLPGPWLVALAFACYSSQWLAVIGFLPSIYSQAGVAPLLAAGGTALAAAINMVGNIGSGRLLQRQVPAPVLLVCGFTAMGLGALLAFAPWSGDGGAAAAGLRYAGVLLFSMLGGLVPGTLFSLGVRVSPDDGSVSTTMGWMQQWSSFGQFAGPPLVAGLAAWTGAWDAVWWVTCSLAAGGIGLALALARLLRRVAPAGAGRATG